MAMCGTFGNYAIVPEISLVKIDDDVDLRFAALIGCGVLTGVGAALNTANIRKGDTVAVVGCGGVGLNVIQGAKIAGAEKIIAVDMFESKLKMAEQFGATDLVKADEGDAVANVMGLTPNGRGADVAFEVIGLGPTIEQTINMTRNGGEAILVGVPRMDVMLNLNAAFTFLYLAKTVKGCWYGSRNVREDVPKLIELYKDGRAQARGARVTARSASTASTRPSRRCSRARSPARSSPTPTRGLHARRTGPQRPVLRRDRKASARRGSPASALPRPGRQGVRVATPPGLHGQQADPQLAGRQRPERLRGAPGRRAPGSASGVARRGCSTRSRPISCSAGGPYARRPHGRPGRTPPGCRPPAAASSCSRWRSRCSASWGSTRRR